MLLPMKPFAAFVRKEFCHIFRDRRTLLILLGLPVALLLILGFAISTEVENSRLMVWAPTSDATVRRVVARLAGNPRFVYAGQLHSVAEVNRAFRRGEADVVVAFCPHFERRLHHTHDASVQIWLMPLTPIRPVLWWGMCVPYCFRRVMGQLGRCSCKPACSLIRK